MTKHLCSIVLVLAACGGDDAPSVEADFVADGTVIPVGAGTTPADGTAIVLWSGDNGQGDFLFKHGEGPATPKAFAVGVDEPLPADATFGNTFGVGVVALVDASVTVPEGVVEDSVFETQLRGFAGQYAIVFKASESPTGVEWSDAFPVGLSCGKCVKATSGFDSFTPVACTELELQVGTESEVDICNWM